MKSGNWNAKGNVIKITANEEVCLELGPHELEPPVLTLFIIIIKLLSKRNYSYPFFRSNASNIYNINLLELMHWVLSRVRLEIHLI